MVPFDPTNPPEHISRVPAFYRSRFGRMTPRVNIGATYSPAIRITPAVHGPEREQAPSAARQALWVGALATGFIAFIGLSTMLFG